MNVITFDYHLGAEVSVTIRRRYSIEEINGKPAEEVKSRVIFDEAARLLTDPLEAKEIK